MIPSWGEPYLQQSGSRSSGHPKELALCMIPSRSEPNLQQSGSRSSGHPKELALCMMLSRREPCLQQSGRKGWVNQAGRMLRSRGHRAYADMAPCAGGACLACPAGTP